VKLWGRPATLMALLLAAVCLGFIVGRRYATVRIPAAHREGRPLEATSLPENSPIDAPRAVVVHKSERAVGLYLEGWLARTYPCGLGSRPVGHKQRAGDACTPEGQYYVCTRNRRSKFHLFLGISYPNADDAAAARREGRISPEEHRTVAEAIAVGRQPPWDTPLGGEIGLHGGGTWSDWTLGCIALENQAIEELWGQLELGDPVIIRP
jgi:murein L,D-transpeptidase YafK